jgi:hypothetical protein
VDEKGTTGVAGTGRASPLPVGPFAVPGAPFVVQSNDEGMARDLEELLGDTRRDAPGTGAEAVVMTVEHAGPSWSPRPWVVSRDGTPVATDLERDVDPRVLLREISRLLLEHVEPDVPVRGAAASLGGRGLLIVGSQALDANAACALGARGWGLLGEGMCVLSTEVEPPSLRPLPLPVEVRPGDWLDRLLDPDTLGAARKVSSLVPASATAALSSPAPLVAVVVAAPAGQDASVVEPLPPTRTLFALAENLPLSPDPATGVVGCAWRSARVPF